MGTRDITSLRTMQGKLTCVSVVTFAVRDVLLACDAFKSVWVSTRSHS